MADLPHLLIVGASARAAAFSALRAGLHPRCVDLFADVDLRQRCAVARLTERYPDDFQRFIENDVPGPWMYTGGLENWPSFVERWSGRRRLWGSDAASLSLARNPEFLNEILQLGAMPVPALVPINERLSREGRRLIKPRKGAGGAGIRFWTEKETSLEKSSVYCQEFIEGESIALLFLGDRGQARLLGLTRQLVGAPWLHAAPFRYCGSIGPIDRRIVQRSSLDALGDLLARECGLCGLFGVDGVLRNGTFWPVEINPRYTASVEVLEYATGLSALASHAHVFTRDCLPPSPTFTVSTEQCVGKAILFARNDLHFPADGPWMDEIRSPRPIHEMPTFADIPAAGEHIPQGRPILTFFARAASPSACEDALRRIAADLDRLLFDR